MVYDRAASPARSNRATPALLAGVAVAVLVAAVGLAARPTLRLPRHEGPAPHSGRDLALTAVTVLIGFVVMARGGRFAARYQRATYRLVGVALIVGPVISVNPIRRMSESNPRPAPTRTPSRRPLGQSGAGRHDLVGWLGLDDLIVLIVGPLALGGLALLAYVVGRKARRPGQHVLAGARIGSGADEAAADMLGRAATAIRLGASARDRVIAAYEAMESALGGQGAARAVQQAPEEWLSGLASSHPHTVGPAGELTGIFERARFSATPITDADADRAGAALEQLRRALAATVPS